MFYYLWLALKGGIPSDDGLIVADPYASYIRDFVV